MNTDNFKLFKSLLKQGFSKIQIKNVNLSVADLSGAKLTGSNLSEADLSKADLSGADLSGADLSEAKLSEADLSRADLSGADLSGADLSGAKLTGAKLNDIIFNELTFGITINCPEIGSFTAFKKAKDKIIVLMIPVSAKRSSATSYKCRCDKAKVLRIENLDGTKSILKSITSDYNSKFIYEVDKVVKVDNFDENRWNECSSGIHFFMNREMAVKYN